MKKLATVGLICIAISILTGIGLGFYILWDFYSSLDPSTLVITSVILTAALPIIAIVFLFVGHWFGRTEVRGFLHGADRMMDRATTMFTTRTEAHAAPRQAPAQPQIIPYSPNQIDQIPIRLISDRPGEGTIIDLSE